MANSVVYREPSEYGCSWQKMEARERMMKDYNNRFSAWIKDSCGENDNVNKDEQPIRKKMKLTQAISIDHFSSSSSSSFSLIAGDEDLLVSQILSRLPVKSLMKFKCVSKRWKSIIEKDAHLINLHLTHSKSRPSGFLIMVAPGLDPFHCQYDGDENRRRGYDLSFMSADLHYSRRRLDVHSVKRIQSSVICLGPVRGLLCLVDPFAVQIFNVGTGEVTPWLKPESLKHCSRLDEVYPPPRFFFGIDPSSGKHKVLCVPWSSKPEVLTVGEDSSWRIIDYEPPSFEPDHRMKIFAYANGSIYCFQRERSSVVVGTYTESLAAFDVGSEKFRMIPIPIFTRLEECGRAMSDSFNGLIEMDGCLTLIRRRCETVKMWKFHDYDKKENGNNSEKEEDWSQPEEIKLPSYIAPDVFVYFHPIPGKRQLMLEAYVSRSFKGSDLDSNDYAQQYFKRNVKFARFYLYNMKSKTFMRIRMNGVSSVPEDCRTTFAPLVESLLPVQNCKIS